jgi:hypothetical protein
LAASTEPGSHDGKGDEGNEGIELVENFEKLAKLTRSFFDGSLQLLSEPKKHFVHAQLNLESWLLALIGAAISSGITHAVRSNELEPFNFWVLLVVNIVCWVAFGTFAHASYLLLGGRASLRASLSTMLQTPALVCVLSSFCAFLTYQASEDLAISLGI